MSRPHIPFPASAPQLVGRVSLAPLSPEPSLPGQGQVCGPHGRRFTTFLHHTAEAGAGSHSVWLYQMCHTSKSNAPCGGTVGDVAPISPRVPLTRGNQNGTAWRHPLQPNALDLPALPSVALRCPERCSLWGLTIWTPAWLGVRLSDRDSTPSRSLSSGLPASPKRPPLKSVSLLWRGLLRARPLSE